LVKFQRTVAQLRKQGKFTNKQYFQVYPSDATPPRIYGMVKAHKPQKNYPMRMVCSTLGSVSHGLAEHLVQIIQPTLDKNETRLKNSTTFANEAASWTIEKGEIQVSYDVVALYPSIPIKKATDAITDIIHSDFDDVEQRTKLELADIRSLIELCLSKCYFLYDNEIYQIDDAGPIGLSLMVVMAEAYLQFLERGALNIALTRCVQPITYKRYVDDSHARFSAADNADKFLEILNEQDPQIQYTIEREDDQKKLAFLDLQIYNDGSGKYDMNVYRKDAITNVQIKPQSCINPRTADGVFKGFLARAYRLCSPVHLHGEIQFLINVFAENGHARSHLEEITNSYRPTTEQSAQEQEETSNTTVVKIPWVPQLGPRLRSTFKKYGVKTVFTSGPNLNSLLCNKNKCKLPNNSKPGVYKLVCSCGSSYVGETKKLVSTRIAEHQREIFNGNWTASGATQHAKTCGGKFNWTDDVTIAVEPDYRRRKVRESLVIRRAQAELNRERGMFNTSSWDAFFYKLDKV